ncbi:MAG: hypothetical protein FIA92_04340, partial [Chloroflexi bacterium]|nr:hypothetical protein [Chloroflexota bacterium]
MRSQRHRRAKTSVVGALLLLIVSGLISPALARPREAPVKADWIVTLEPGARAADHGREAARAAGGSMGRLYQHALNGFEFRGTAAAAAALLRNPLVRTVVRDGSLHAIAESIPPGIRRIDAHHPSQPDAHEAGFTGAGVRVAILDTGVDLTHPDLIGNLDADLGLNCMTAGPPQDGHGHGTHVAGITAAVTGNDVGVAGVAPDARIVPIKVLDDTGYGEWSNLICAIDYLTGLMLDTDPDNDVLVANMSLGDVGSIGDCLDGGVREAICTSVEAGITYVAAAGNSTVNVSTFIPAAYPEVIAVSAITDLDGEPGGLGGCWLWIVYCDDTLAEFSNYGLGIDVAGPGTNIYSSWVGGGYRSESGTSMAAPHVAGVAALVKAARPAMTPTDIEDLLKATGECANGAFADADGSDSCAGKGTRGNDPDGYGEPLVNALHAAQAATTWSARPTVTITEPSHGDLVSGAVLVVADADDDEGVASVEFLVNGRLASTDTDGSDGWSFVWDSDAAFAGAYSLTARAVDVGGRAATDSVDVSTGSNVQGDWVGRYGQAGYALFAWTSTSDLVLLPTATM